jgi:hypothetical protein
MHAVDVLAEEFGVPAAAITFARRGMPDGMTTASFDALVNILEANKAMAKLTSGQEDGVQQDYNGEGKRGRFQRHNNKGQRDAAPPAQD